MTDRQLMQLALDALETASEVGFWELQKTVVFALRERLAHCDRCGKRLGGEGDIHTCTPDPIGDAQDRLIVEMAAQPEQEPAAYLCENAVGHKYFRWKKPSSTYKPIALYTTPPQRTWVGLTEDEVYKIAFTLEGEHWKKITEAIEDKLKEKNT